MHTFVVICSYNWSFCLDNILCLHICSSYRYRWAFVPEVDVSRYSGPENALIESEQECMPHVVRVLEGIQQRYGVRNQSWNLKNTLFGVICE